MGGQRTKPSKTCKYILLTRRLHYYKTFLNNAAKMATTFVTCIVTSVTFCLCSATTSLMGACCGNDKLSSVTPGSSSGRKRSVLLLCMAIAIAFAFQYGVAKYIVGISISNYLTRAWLSGCEDFETDALIEGCAGQAGVYRPAFSALVSL